MGAMLPFVGQPILAAAAFQAAFSPCDALFFATSDTFPLAIPRPNREAPKRLTSAKTLYNTQQLLYNLQREKRRHEFSQPLFSITGPVKTGARG